MGKLFVNWILFLHTLRTYNLKKTLSWKIKALADVLCHPFVYKPFFGNSLTDFYLERTRQKKQRLPVLPLQHCIDPSKTITLANCISQGANISSLELMCLVGIIVKRSSQRLLEIGTYDGNTTLQMGWNTSEDAVIHTLDLPDDQLDFVLERRRYVNTLVEKKITQHYGDSKNYNFGKFAEEGPLDFIFIDGDHSYEAVKNDTEKALEILAPGGCILWHDYTPWIPGVFQYLDEFLHKCPIQQIEGTTLAFFEKTI